MKGSGIFLSGISVLLLLNLFYIFMTPTASWTMTIGALSGLVASVLGVGLISGIQIFGSGFNSTSIKLLFGVATILNLMFQINLAGFPIGMGLFNNMLSLFSTNSFLESLGFFSMVILGILIIAGGLVIMMGGD